MYLSHARSAHRIFFFSCPNLIHPVHLYRFGIFHTRSLFGPVRSPLYHSHLPIALCYQTHRSLLVLHTLTLFTSTPIFHRLLRQSLPHSTTLVLSLAFMLNLCMPVCLEACWSENGFCGTVTYIESGIDTSRLVEELLGWSPIRHSTPALSPTLGPMLPTTQTANLSS